MFHRCGMIGTNSIFTIFPNFLIDIRYGSIYWGTWKTYYRGMLYVFSFIPIQPFPCRSRLSTFSADHIGEIPFSIRLHDLRRTGYSITYYEGYIQVMSFKFGHLEEGKSGFIRKIDSGFFRLFISVCSESTVYRNNLCNRHNAICVKSNQGIFVCELCCLYNNRYIETKKYRNSLQKDLIICLAPKDFSSSFLL